MKNRHTVNAFTILEVTIALLVATICIAITYSAYTIVGNAYRNYQKRNITIAEALLLDKLFKQDFSIATKIALANNNLYFYTPNGVNQYELNEEYLIRNQHEIRRDTFFIAPTNLTCLFEKQEVHGNGLLDELEFSAHVEDEMLPFSYEKHYSADELIQAKPY